MGDEVPSCLLTDLPDELLVSIFHCTRRASLSSFVALASVSTTLLILDGGFNVE